MMKIANLDGFSNRAELRRRMTEWTTSTWEQPPQPATLRDKLREIADYLELPPT